MMPVGEVRILGHDGEALLPGMVPELSVGRVGAEGRGKDDWQRGPEPQPGGQVLIEQETLHATGWTE